MSSQSGRRLSTWTTLALLAAVFTIPPATFGDDTTRPLKKGEAALGRRVLRLPPHFAKVVNEAQRKQIYVIQEEYQAKLDTLEAQIKLLKKERNDKIAAVLTPDQRKKIEAASGKAKKTFSAPVELPPEAPLTEQKTPK
jgi:hypothetical protein